MEQLSEWSKEIIRSTERNNELQVKCRKQELRREHRADALDALIGIVFCSVIYIAGLIAAGIIFSTAFRLAFK